MYWILPSSLQNLEAQTRCMDVGWMFVCSLLIWERRSVFLTFWLQCQCPSCKSHTTDKRSSFGKKTLEMDISKQHLLYWYWLHMSRLKYGNYFQRVLFSIFFFTPAQLKRQNEKEPALCFLLNAKKGSHHGKCTVDRSSHAWLVSPPNLWQARNALSSAALLPCFQQNESKVHRIWAFGRIRL